MSHSLIAACYVPPKWLVLTQMFYCPIKKLIYAKMIVKSLSKKSRIHADTLAFVSSHFYFILCNPDDGDDDNDDNNDDTIHVNASPLTKSCGLETSRRGPY